MENRTNCQVFPIGQGDIIAFLEKESSNDSSVFIPTDFSDVLFDEESTNEVLANTCDLKQLLPTELTLSTADMCPAVSTNPICIRTTKAMNVNNGGLSPTVIPGGSQANIDNVRSKSGLAAGDGDNMGNTNTLNISILLTIFVINFVKLI